MKTYIFVTRRITEICGAEQYIYNKATYLESQGWRVLVFSGKKGTAYIDGFKKYYKYIIPELFYWPDNFTGKRVRSIVDKIVSIIKTDNMEQCIIESDSVLRAAWSELIAKELNCKHLVYVLTEAHDYTGDVKKFLRFKLDRHELAGINPKSVGQMLKDPDIPEREDIHIRAFCNNVVADCEDMFSEKLDRTADYTFGSIGRLDKQCVPEIINSYKQYFKSHPEKRFNLVLIGGSVFDGIKEKIMNSIAECSNVKLLNTGNIYPIPKKLISNIDLFVSTAGSANVSYLFCRPTIKVHPVTGQPVGIMGLDAGNMYEAKENVTICDYITKIVNGDVDITYKENAYENYDANMAKEFEKQLAYADIPTRCEYYDTEKLLKLNVTFLKAFIIKILLCVFGYGAVDEVIRIKRLFGKKY